MNSQGLAWGSLLLLAILLIVGSIQGSHGRMLAVIFAPAFLSYDDITADQVENLERSKIQNYEQSIELQIARAFYGS